MMDLETVEREIATLQESIGVATRALDDPSLSVEGKNREQASVELYQRHLDDLLTKRDDLQVSQD
jgi:hypothetical protein